MNEEVMGLVPLEAKGEISKAIELCESIKELKIGTQEEFDASAGLLKQVKDASKALDAKKKELTHPYKSKASVIDSTFKVALDALDNASGVIARAVGSYQQILERKRQEEQRKREAEAEEIRRKAAAAAAEEQRKAEEYRAQGREEMAQKAEARAEAKADVAVNTVAAIVEDQKPAGLSFRTDYNPSVIDKAQAVAACMANPMLAPAIVIDLGALKKATAPMKGKLEIPGIRFIEEKIPISRR